MGEKRAESREEMGDEKIVIAKIEAIVASAQKDIIKEILIQSDKISLVDKRLATVEYEVTGISGDPNNRGIVNRCVEHDKRISLVEDYIIQDKIEDAEKTGYQKGSAKAAIIALKNKEITVKWGVAIIALIGVVLSSTVLQTVVNHLVGG